MNIGASAVKSKPKVVLLIIVIVLVFISSDVVMGAEMESLDQFLLKQISQIEKLPPVIYSQGQEWFKTNGSILDAPRNDFRFKISDKNSNNTISYIFYFDTDKSIGYLQKRGGIADIVTWFGPFTISNELTEAINTYRKPPPSTILT